MSGDALKTNIVIISAANQIKKNIDQSPELCLDAVKEDKHSLFFVKNQTYAICSIAVKYHVQSLKYMNVYYKEVFLEADQLNCYKL